MLLSEREKQSRRDELATAKFEMQSAKLSLDKAIYSLHFLQQSDDSILVFHRIFVRLRLVKEDLDSLSQEIKNLEIGD